jgi:hypothetical protein
MRHRSFTTVFILTISLAGLISGWFLYGRSDANRYQQAQQVLRAPSAIRLNLVVTHDAGPIVREEYAMADLDGISSATYRAVGRDGVAIAVRSLPRQTYDVSFFFEKAVQDGIWELRSKPPRGNVSTHYTMSVYQLVDKQHGSHTIAFTDPNYWATTGGQQFHITLDRNKPVPDLVQLKSTSLVEPRYARLVDDFRTFGSAAFRSKVTAAQTRLRAAS